MAASQVWRWVSTKPGMTIIPLASTTSASASIRGATWAIVSPSMRTSPVGRSPRSGSTVRTVPPRSRSRSAMVLLLDEEQPVSGGSITRVQWR
jgi:hypothetical protein